MDYKVFYRKYRPKNFDELVGQDSIKDILVNSIKLNKIAHAYIFTGPRGTGKTSTAKIFAKTLNCINSLNGISCDKCDMCMNYIESPDIIEIDAASNNGVEEIRSLRDNVKTAPYYSKYKVYIIDEVHMLSNSAWNAFLKTLEEPPSHVIFILATTEINKIPETVMSRCQRFDFSKIPSVTMIDQLSKICKLENIDIESSALETLSKMSNGCLRDALTFLDKISKYNQNINVALLEKTFGVLNNVKLDNLYNYIVNNELEKINEIIDEISNSGITPLNFINEFVEFLLNKLINKDYKENTNLMRFIKTLIFKLNNIVLSFNATVNPFILIKVELITNYFPGNNADNISWEINKDIKTENVVKNENIIESDEFENNLISTDKIKNIRINNSFVNASKELKLDFSNKWKSFISKLNIESEYNLLGYIETAEIVVVSATNVLFSFKNDNEAIIFNKNLNIIENKFNEYNSVDLRFFALSTVEWNNERDKFINNKNKNYTYIDENAIEDQFESKNIALDIFGEDIIEIR